MQTLVQISIKFSAFCSTSLHKHSDSNNKYTTIKSKFAKPISCYIHSTRKIESLHEYRLKAGALRDRLSFSGVGRGKNGILVSGGKRVIGLRLDKGFNALGGGGNGGGRVNSETARVIGNLALAILLTYFTMTGQLGWLLDAVVSIWLIAVLVPIVGIGAFLWWAGRDIVQSSCPNCGNEFQVFKSTLNDEVQLCPFCTQPFSVVGDKFVRDPVTFSNQSTMFDQGFSDFSPRTKKGKGSSGKVVDVEAEIRDAE